ncbi:MAG: hypothetical protein H7Y08_03025, partial [Rhizobiaceae bacterium]|nr:hypothetical protein [Rhizobiaceae bacterium]
MSNPPRRSKPRKPGATIDLTASPTPSVGYPGPISPAEERQDGSIDSAAPRDAETRTAEAASPASTNTDDGVPATSASTPANAVREGPESDDGGSDRSAAQAFAAEESLTGMRESERPQHDLDETILSAAVPDFVAGDDRDTPTEPPPPTFDYNHTTPPPAESRGGFGSAFGGAVLGAVLALAGAGALQYSGFIPALSGADNAEELAQFARTGDVQQVTTDIGTLRGEVEQLRSAQAAGGTG